MSVGLETIGQCCEMIVRWQDGHPSKTHRPRTCLSCSSRTTKIKIWMQLIAASHTHTRLTALFPGLPGSAGTRKVKPICILLKQEIVSGSGINWAICKCAPCSRQITTPTPHHSVFYRPDALPAAQPTASKHWRPRLHTMQNMTNDQPPRPSQPPILSRTEICDTRLNSRAFTCISFSLAKWWQPFKWISCLFYLQADSTQSHHPLYVDCLMSVPTIQIWTDYKNKTIPQG